MERCKKDLCFSTLPQEYCTNTVPYRSRLRKGFYCNYLILINYLVLSCLCMYILFNLERAKASTITVSTAIIT